jgi:hypothetical protein
MPRRRHQWFAHRPQLFMRRHRRRLSMRHRRRLSSMRCRRSCVHRHHRWFMHHRRLRSSMRRRRRSCVHRHHRPRRLFVRHPQRPALPRCVESPDYRRAPSRHNKGLTPL